MVLGKRLIAFFDILGFSKRIENEDITKLNQELGSFLDEANQKVFSSVEIKPNNQNEIRSNFEVSLVAFDSILLVSHSLEQTHSASNFIMACIELIKISGTHNFPLRGGIDLDEVIYDKEKKIILSKAQPRLVHLEKNQEWVGCCVTNVAFDEIKKTLFGPGELNINCPIVNYPPIMKTTNLNKEIKGISDYSLNWVITDAPKNIEKVLEDLIEPKKTNTKKFIDFILTSPNANQRLNPPVPPVYNFRYLGSRLSASFLFLDENFIPVDPVNPLCISISDGITTGKIFFQGNGILQPSP